MTVFPWVPCASCEKSFDRHIEGHCPFDSTSFSPPLAEVEMALNEMSHRLPRRYNELKPMDEELLAQLYKFCRDNK